VRWRRSSSRVLVTAYLSEAIASGLGGDGAREGVTKAIPSMRLHLLERPGRRLGDIG